MMHKDNWGDSPVGNSTSTGLPVFAQHAVNDTIIDLVYCSTSTLAQTHRAAGMRMTHQLQCGMYCQFAKDHPFLNVDAGKFFDILHYLHFDVIAR